GRFRTLGIAVGLQKQAEIRGAAGNLWMLRPKLPLSIGQRLFKKRPERGQIGGRRGLPAETGGHQKRNQTGSHGLDTYAENSPPTAEVATRSGGSKPRRLRTETAGVLR